MKSLLLLFMVTVCSNFLLAQYCTPTPEIKSEIQDLADWAAGKLMNCCSTFGGKTLSATVYFDADSDGRCQTRISRLTNSLIITMKIQWYGSWTGTRYWIKGKLTVDLDSGKKKWHKISDSEGFSPGCSQGCIE